MKITIDIPTVTTIEFNEIYDFLAYRRYPNGFSKNQKRMLRRKSAAHCPESNEKSSYKLFRTKKDVDVSNQKKKAHLFQSENYRRYSHLLCMPYAGTAKYQMGSMLKMQRMVSLGYLH
jgi:hypothetical protein